MPCAVELDGRIYIRDKSGSGTYGSKEWPRKEADEADCDRSCDDVWYPKRFSISLASTLT